jgi:chromosome segregation ATPase
VRGPQKLESDVRGHIRLEHEMKIHMDYLENKIELFQAQASTWEKEKARLIRQLETATDKLALVKESKDREIKDLNRKLTEMGNKLSSQLQRTNEVERKLSQERDNFSKKVRSMNNSVEYKTTDQSGIQSSKSKQKNQKYLNSINSGAKSSSTEPGFVPS